MNNGVMDRGDSGVPAWAPISSLFSRLGALGCFIDPFAAGTFWQDTAGTVAPVPDGVIARIDSPSGSPTIASLTQATVAKQLILRSSGLELDGIEDYLSYPDDANLRFGTTDFTVAAAVYITGGSPSKTILSKRGAGSTPGAKPGWGMRVTDVGAIVLEYDYVGNVGTVVRTVTPNGAVQSNAWANIMCRFNYSTGLAEGIVNNVVQSGSYTFTPGDLSAGTTFQPLMLGGAVTINFLGGRIGRCLAINKLLSTGDRLVVNDWLSGGRP